MTTPPRTGTGYGGFPAQQTAAPGYDLPNPQPAQPVSESRRGNLRRNAGWAFVGAALVSVVWTAVVLTVPGMVTTKGSPLGLRGYHAVDDLCATAKLVKFNQIYRKPDDTPNHRTDRATALDSMSCVLSLQQGSVGGSDGDADYASLYAQVGLHKAVNVSAEFDAEKDGRRQAGYRITDVPGFGDSAYTAYRDEPSGTDKSWHSITHELLLREGGMTYYLSWSGSYQEGRTTVPEQETIRQALLADSRDLLKAIGGR
ncbi:hypothetical protein [Kitasatospora herbaricolor]|uniref:Uncharacterized protein n=1 Tax=Kitasatospora herbaricolor TaxID=68217 RepID=A0ABZ1WDE0_9ACTN|nr:hypothetical protein [Kitasatospora herbaricolor]